MLDQYYNEVFNADKQKMGYNELTAEQKKRIENSMGYACWKASQAFRAFGVELNKAIKNLEENIKNE